MILKNKLVVWLTTKYMLWKINRYFKKHPDELEKLLNNIAMNVIEQLSKRETYIKRADNFIPYYMN